MARQPSDYAITFAELLNAKFPELHGETYGVVPGNKMDKIVVEHGGVARSVHAFVRKEDGAVFKAATWAQPAKGVRYTNVLDAAEKSDRHGRYLYAR